MSNLGGFDGYSGRRVLVTGASGFIGRWVARGLTAAGARLWLTARDEAIARGIWRDYTVEGEILLLDLRQLRELPTILREVRPAVVFNLAGYGVAREQRDAVASETINHQWVERLALEVARSRDESWPGLALVHAGSALEYGDVGGDLHEDGPTNPTTLYGRTKLAGAEALRRVAQRCALPAATARLFTVYGPGESASRLLPSLIAAANGAHSIPLTEGLQERDFTYVEDAAEGLLRLGQSSEPSWSGEAVNLATGVLTSVRDFVLIAAGVLGIDRARLRFGELPVRDEEMRHEPVNIRRLVERLGWRPTTPPRVGVSRTLEIASRAADT